MRRLIILSFVLLAGVFNVSADWKDCLKPKPEKKELVFQYVQFLSPSEEQRLNAKLKDFAVSTSNQIMVIVVDTLCGLPPWQYATEIGHKWGVGGERMDNGIVVLVKPIGKPGKRHVHIATGYGLGGAIPDLTCKRIVENEVLPEFKKGRAYAGLDKGTNVLMALALEEYNHQDYAKPSGSSGFPWGVLIFFLFMVSIILLGYRRRVNRYAELNNLGFWDAWWLLSQADNKHAGDWKRFSGGTGGVGGGGWSGGGGGGFGGFGGGGFGGGGAGGSW